MAVERGSRPRVQHLELGLETGTDVYREVTGAFAAGVPFADDRTFVRLRRVP